MAGLRRAYTDVQLHLIGALQSNKAAEAVGLFDVIHSLDGPNWLLHWRAPWRRAGAIPVFSYR